MEMLLRFRQAEIKNRMNWKISRLTLEKEIEWRAVLPSTLEFEQLIRHTIPEVEALLMMGRGGPAA